MGGGGDCNIYIYYYDIGVSMCAALSFFCLCPVGEAECLWAEPTLFKPPTFKDGPLSLTLGRHTHTRTLHPFCLSVVCNVATDSLVAIVRLLLFVSSSVGQGLLDFYNIFL